MHRIGASVVLIGLLVGAVRVEAACVGDGNDDGRVEVAELIQLVGCVLRPQVACPVAGIDGVVTAVLNALHGCDLEPRWLTSVPCVQCAPCFLPINVQISIANGDLDSVPELDGVRFLDQWVEQPTVVCQACGCPVVTFHALVARRNAPQLIDLGWQGSAD